MWLFWFVFNNNKNPFLPVYKKSTDQICTEKVINKIAKLKVIWIKDDEGFSKGFGFSEKYNFVSEMCFVTFYEFCYILLLSHIVKTRVV